MSGPLVEKELCVRSHASELRCSDSEVPRDSAEYQHLLDVAMRLVGLASRRPRFPGTQPFSIMRSELPQLQDGYMAALKTDGVRTMLLLARDQHGEPRAVTIDRMLCMFEVEIWGDTDFFRGTLYDAELMWQYEGTATARLALLVFDIFALRGVSCLHETYSTRIALVHSTLLTTVPPGGDVEQMVLDENKICAQNNNHDLRLLPKRVLSAHCTRELWESRHCVNHLNDGIIFTPNTPYTDRKTFKWKTEHTVDLLFETPQRFFMGGRAGLLRLEHLVIDGISRRALTEPNQLLDLVVGAAGGRAIIECLCVVDRPDEVRFVPLKQRTDKDSPNQEHTIRATVQNAIESISCEELQKAIEAGNFLSPLGQEIHPSTEIKAL